MFFPTMSTIIKRNDPASSEWGRSCTFATSTNDFVQGDILDVKNSLGGKAGGKAIITTGVGASTTFRINSISKKVPMKRDTNSLLGNYSPRLNSEQNISNPRAPSFTVGESTSLVIENIPISNIEIDSLVTGGGAGVSFTIF